MSRFCVRASTALIALLACALVGCGGGGGSAGDNPQPTDTTAPTAPGSLTAAPVSSTQINLTWAASTDSGSGVASYRVLRNGAQAAQVAANVTSYSDAGLTAATTYSYRVVAVDNAANRSADSNEAQATTLAQDAAAGLDSRPGNTTCLAGARPGTGGTTTGVQLQNLFPGLSFQFPLAAMQAPDSRWYVVEKAGRLRMIDPASPTTSTVVLDISSRVNVNIGDQLDERGLLGLAFHPQFQTNGKIYVNYVHAPETGGYRDTTRISEFTRASGALTFDQASERVMLRVHQPADNHNGGHLAFGPDGYLYIGMGDGGDANDDHDLPSSSADGNAQNLLVLLGKMLRIDVNTTTGAVPYGIPTDNPYRGGPTCHAGAISTQNCPEIYASGLRNPWRWSFDRANGDLWVADVQQGAFEEVNRVVRGGNYGWPCREGAAPFALNPVPAACSGKTLTDPVAVEDRSDGQSITGGFVYRGPQATNMVGRYIFADFSTGMISALDPAQLGSSPVTCRANSTGACQELKDPYTPGNYSSFAEGADGELYILDYGVGQVQRVVFQSSGGGGGAPTPTNLSATGCVNPSNPAQPAAGLVPYAPNAPFWSDAAEKSRWIALPDGATMSAGADGDFAFPNGAVLMKNFRLGGNLIETRFFKKHTDGSWAGYTYEWNAAQTDATLVASGGKTKVIGAQTWIYPSQGECLQCHTAPAGSSLSVEVGQLNGDLLYPQTGRTANQLTTLNAVGMVAPPTPVDATTQRFHDPVGTTGTLEQRARAYLHSNCSQCHRPGTTIPAQIDLRYSTSLAQTGACNVSPLNGAFGITNAQIIAPGDAARSVLRHRMNNRGASTGAMPPIGSNLVDQAGVQLITDWINSLQSC
jgi:uncharacterized repeat protein (TIGR03806 family)